MPPFPRARPSRPSRPRSGGRSTRSSSSFSEPIAAASIAQVHKARVAAPAGERDVAVKVLRPGVRDALPRAISTPWRFAARHRRAHRARAAAAAPGRGRRDAGPLRRRWRWTCASRPPPCPRWPRTPRDDADFRVPKLDWERTARDVLTHRMDRRHPAERPRGDRGGRARPRGAGPQRHPVLPAPRAARRLLPRRHAPREPVRRPAGPARAPSISASWAGSARRSGASWPRSCSASSAATTGASPRCISRRATCPAHHAVEDFAQAIRAIGEPIHDRTRRRDLDGEAADAAVRDHRPLRHGDAHRARHAAEDHGGGRGRGPQARPASSTCGRTSEPVVREWIERNLGPIGTHRGGAGAALATFAGLVRPICRRSCGRAERLVAEP